MLRYSLVCDDGHGFESWFPGSEACDAQMARGIVTCPVCGSAKVEKAVMAPAIARSGREAPAQVAAEPEPAPPAAPGPVALISEEERTARRMLKALRDHVVANADDVGADFARVARQMHEGEIDHRSVYGVATPEEVRDLHEDGIEAHPLPILPDEGN